LSIKVNNTIYAAEYMKMSTDHPKYSLDNQSGYIREYAKESTQYYDNQSIQ